MTELEKVIKGLKECCGTGKCQECVYGKEHPALSCKSLLGDALSILKRTKLIHTEHALYTVYEPNKGDTNDALSK